MRGRPGRFARGRGRWGRRLGLGLGLGAVMAAALGGGADAAVQPSAAAPGPGYSCRDTKIGAAGGRTFALTTVLAATRVTFQGSLTRTPGLPMATSGSLTVSTGRSRWRLHPITFVNGAGVLPNTGADQVCALRFGREPHPEVLLQPYTGGAHCCVLPFLYTYSARAASYRLSARATLTEGGQPAGPMPPYDPNGGLGPRLEQGHLVLATDDGRFPYQFACFACSAAPVLLLGDTGGRFVDITRSFPKAVAGDARRLWSAVHQDLAHHTEVLGVVPAWVADECRLGDAAAAFAAVGRLQRAGDFSARLGPGFDGTGSAYVANLRRFLLRTGYCR